MVCFDMKLFRPTLGKMEHFYVVHFSLPDLTAQGNATRDSG